MTYNDGIHSLIVYNKVLVLVVAVFELFVLLQRVDELIQGLCVVGPFGHWIVIFGRSPPTELPPVLLHIFFARALGERPEENSSKEHLRIPVIPFPHIVLGHHGQVGQHYHTKD
jgi:hypothetical protein